MPNAEQRRLLAELSPAQRIVLRGLAHGKKLVAIVDDLPPEYRVSVYGLKWHNQEIYRKLKVHTVAEATRIAVLGGLVE